jgi:hypothetical protein
MESDACQLDRIRSEFAVNLLQNWQSSREIGLSVDMTIDRFFLSDSMFRRVLSDDCVNGTRFVGVLKLSAVDHRNGRR